MNKFLFHKNLPNYRHPTEYPTVYIEEYSYAAVGTRKIPKITVLI